MLKINRNMFEHGLHENLMSLSF